MLEDHIDAVKAHIAYYEKQAKLYVPGQKLANAETLERTLRWVEQFVKLLAYLNQQKRLAAPVPKSLGDISDLPEELVKELALTRTDELEDQILTVMRACAGEVNLDQVLVGLYRKFKVVQTRRYIQNKLYRMSKKDLVYAVPGQRAAYNLEPQPEAKAAAPSKAPPSDLDDEIPF